jgi:hypothetical protein
VARHLTGSTSRSSARRAPRSIPVGASSWLCPETGVSQPLMGGQRLGHDLGEGSGPLILRNPVFSPAHPPGPFRSENVTYMLWINRCGNGRLVSSRAATDACSTWNRDPQSSQEARTDPRRPRARVGLSPRLDQSNRAGRARSLLDRAIENRDCPSYRGGRAHPAGRRAAERQAIGRLRRFDRVLRRFKSS